MKVVLQSPAELVLHDGALGTVLMGALFLSVGGGAITLWIVDPTGWSGNGGAWVIYFVGGAFLLIGLALLALSADRRYEIDRGTNKATFIVRRLLHRTSAEYPLADLKDAALERSQGAFYRVVFLTKAGGRIPWTPISTGDRGDIAACVTAVRAFCGWHGGEATPVPMAQGAVSGHPAATSWGLMAAILAVFVAIGLGLFGVEVRRVMTYEPVTARVLSTDIRTVSGDKGNTYAPVVRYEYSLGGSVYNADHVLPLSMSSSMRWAEGLRDRFRPGQTVTAYVSPTDPSRAFLIREVSYMPLWFVGMPLGMALLFGWVVRYQRRQLEVVTDNPVPIVEA